MAPTDDLASHNVKSLHGLPLCVECLACRRRVLVPAERFYSRTVAEMDSLIAASRRLRCRVCGSGAVKAQRPFSLEDAQAWVAGRG